MIVFKPVLSNSSKVECGVLCSTIPIYISDGFVNLSRESREQHDDVRNEIERIDINFNEILRKLNEQLGWWSVVLSLRVSSIVYSKFVVGICAFPITFKSFQQKFETSIYLVLFLFLN